MGEELETLSRRYACTDVNFQDETFFTTPRSVAAIAEELLRRGTSFTWSATMRADQGYRLDEEVLRLCRRSGLRRVMIGVESGSPEMLKRIEKDITVEQVFDTAEKCLRQDVGVLFNLIVGFPGRPRRPWPRPSRWASAAGALLLRARRLLLQALSGNPLADAHRAAGHPYPSSLAEWRPSTTSAPSAGSTPSGGG